MPPTLSDRLNVIDQRLDKINLELGQLIGAQKTTALLIKYVVLPLIAVVGALVGIKLF